MSRGILFALLIAGSQISFLRKVDGGSVWETRIELRDERLLPELIRVSMTGDAWWYRSIALQGYGPRADADGAPNYAFFPLYPLIVRYARVTGDFALDGLLVSNFAFAVTLLLLGPWGMRSGLTEEETERAIVFLAFFPTSYFGSMPLPESLFLALSVASVLAAVTRRWPIAGILGALGALTRLQGVLLFLPLLIIFFRSGDKPRAKALWLLLVPTGTAAFSIYLQRLTGNFLSFMEVQANWGRAPGFFWTPLLAYVSAPSVIGASWNLLALNFAVAVLLFVCGVALLIQRRWELGAYTIASLLLPLSSGSLQSLGRYAMVVFPLYAWLALATRRAIVDRMVLATLVVLFGWLVAMFVLRVDFALA